MPTDEKPLLRRHPANPIIRPGGFPWRAAVTFNPAVIHENGVFYLYERTAGSLRPFHCFIGLMESRDGVHFEPSSDEPVITPAMLGSEYGSVQDPRVVKLDGRYYMTYAFRPYAWASHPTGVGVPESHQVDYPGFSGNDADNQTRSGIAVSDDLKTWQHLTWVNPPGIDDRNVILFPEKINGRYCILRRPSGFVSTNAKHTEHPVMQLSWSDDLLHWSDPEPYIRPEFGWENNRIGGSTPPIRTEHGWLILYHAVETTDEATRHVVYRLGALLADLDDPTRIVARCPHCIMEPEEYYEKTGLYIPDVIFPTGAAVVEGMLHLYYGCCDTAIGLATIELDVLLQYILQFPPPG